MTKRHGFVYTMFAILLAGSVVTLIALQTVPSTNFRVAEKVKTDETAYFLKGVQDDLARTSQISGKRAMISMIDKEVLNGTFIPSVNESLRVAMIQGTYNNTPLSLTVNNTLEDWELRMNDLAEVRGTSADIEFKTVQIIPSDLFSLAVSSTALVEVSDSTLRFSIKRNVSAPNTIAIDGLEDPLNTIKSNVNLVQRYVRCSAASGTNSTGDWFSGLAYVTNETSLATINGVGRVAVLYNPVLITNIGNFDGYIIDQQAVPITIPAFAAAKYVMGLPNAQGVVTNNTYVAADNTTVWLTNMTDSQTNSTCYFAARFGPSFLDRLEGNYSTSPGYSSQVSGTIGIASYIYFKNLPAEMINASIARNHELDYKYWQGLGY